VTIAVRAKYFFTLLLIYEPTEAILTFSGGEGTVLIIVMLVGAHCRVLGGFRIFDRTGAELRFPIVKGAAIIAYLCSRSGNQASRGELTGLLWGDKPEATARTALRQCLHQMRFKLSGFEPEFLNFTSNSVNLDRNKLSLDADMLVNPDHILDLAHPGEVRADQFLLGFEDLDPSFSEWLWEERAKLDERFKAMLKTILRDPKISNQHQIRAAQHLNLLDPSNELAARHLIEEAAADNDLVALLRVYQKLWDTLGEDWGEEPSADLQTYVGQTRVRLGDPQHTTPVRLNVTPIRRYVSVLAISVSSKNRNASEVDSQLDNARAVIASLNGTVVDSHSDKLCAVFGLEIASENSARDAIEVALNIAAKANYEGKPTIGLGVDAGYVLAKPAMPTQHQPEVEGGVLEQAESLAKANCELGVLVSARALYGVENFYQFSHNPNHENSPSNDALVVGRKPAANTIAPRGKRETFVGRAPFLAALWEIWIEALGSSSPQIASVQGAAGIGKTRLADELLRRLAADGVCTARAVCNRYDRSSPLEPLRELLYSLQEVTGSETEDSHPRSRTDKPSSIEAIVEKLDNSLQESPTAIFIDDWQWADDATRLALSKLVNSESRSSMLLVLTSRNVPADEWLVTNSHQFVLPSFTAKEVAERAELLLDRPIDEALRQQILSKSGGNPLLLEEVCHATENSLNGWVPDEMIVDPSASLQGLFVSRFERLSEDELEILFSVAVHGDRVQPELLSKVIGRSVSPQSLDDLDQKDILTIVGATSIRFKHSLARDVIYNMIPNEKRQALHRNYAECLKNGAVSDDENLPMEALAFHYRGCGDIARASEFSEKSGDKALNASALDQAFRHYGMALDLVDQLPKDETVHKRWISLAIRWAIPTTYAPSYELLPLLERAEKMAKQIGDLHSVAALRYWIGYFLYVLGEKDQALKYLRNSRKVADEVGAVQQSVEVTAIEGCLLASISQYDTAETAMREALKIKDRHPGKSDRASVTSVYTRANLALLRADQGHFDEAQSLMNEALFRVRGFEHEVESSILLFSGAINIWRGAWDTALDDARRSRERSEKVSSLYLMGMSRCIWGYSHWKIHGNSLGLETLVKNARWMQNRGMGMYYSLIAGWAADALADAGRHEDAEAAYLDAQERASCGEIAGMAMACRATASIALSNENFATAAERLTEATAIAERRGAAHETAANNLMYARLYHAQDRREDAFAAVKAAKAAYVQLGLDQRYSMAGEVEALISR